MKTAEELFNGCNHDIGLSYNKPLVITLVEFTKALTEHDKEIKDMIDEMIEGLKGECEDCGEDYNACSCVASIPIGEKIEALTELKDKLK